MAYNKLQETKDLPNDRLSSHTAGTSRDASNGVPTEVDRSTNLKEQQEEKERMARVNATWESMNSGLPPSRAVWKGIKPTPAGNKNAKKSTPDWLVAMGLGPKKVSSRLEVIGERKTSDVINVDYEEAKKLAAAALSAVREISSAAAAAASAAKGRIEITEVKDFAGEAVEVKKLVDTDSREAAAVAAVSGAPPTALDCILDQIKKKQKLSVLDKTKKDWGEFKENKGLEEELDAYKKSSNQYLDKVSFLQRTDLREFERERDARLAIQSKRRTESMQEEDDL